MTQTPETSSHDDRPIPAMALWLGMGGAIPFVGLSGLMLLQYSGLAADTGLPDRLFYHLLMTYAALIASFLGGIRWGIALPRPSGNSLLWVSVIPSLMAWVALALPRLRRLHCWGRCRAGRRRGREVGTGLGERGLSGNGRRWRICARC